MFFAAIKNNFTLMKYILRNSVLFFQNNTFYANCYTKCFIVNLTQKYNGCGIF